MKSKLLTALFVAASVLTTAILPSQSLATNTDSFKDVDSKHWAYKNIEKVANQKLVTGYEDGTFKPSNNVTRAEFATFLSRVFDGVERKTVLFTDVSDTFWGKDAIEEGLSLGFIQETDYKNNKFEPNKVMTRQEIAKWLANGLKASNGEYGTIASDIQNGKYTLLPVTEFNNGGLNKADYGNVGLMIGTGLMSGYDDGSFKVSGNTTRAEVATILIRFGDALKKAPSSFKGLNELVEVAKTGTNMLSATRFVYLGKDDFTAVAGKPLKWSNGLGTGTVERMIFIEGRDYKKALNNSIFAKMFVADKWSVLDYENYITVYFENGFTSNKSKTGIEEYSNGHTSRYFSNTGVSVKELTKRYGYLSHDSDNWGDLFKKDQKVRFWTMKGLNYGHGEWHNMGIAGESGFTIKYQ